MNSLKNRNSSNILEHSLQTKIPHMKQIRADWSHGMLAVIRCRIYCLPVSYPKI